MCGKQSAKFRKFSRHLSGAGTFTQILKREFERSRVKCNQLFSLSFSSSSHLSLILEFV